MRLAPRLIRRAGTIAAAVIAAVITTAAVIPAVALAAPGQATSHATAAAGCAQAQLQTWLGLPPGVAAGTEYFELEISNISARTCTLFGFPGVSALSASGAQLGSAAERDGSYQARLVTLARGATAHVDLGIVSVANFPASACHVATASSLRVFAPGDFRSETLRFPFTFGACQNPGPKFLLVSPAIAGTGIPHFSS
jgi:hypothetical protein